MGVRVCFSRAEPLRTLQESPLGAYIQLFADRLLKEGHSKQSAGHNFRVVRNFSRWMLQKKLGLGVLNEQLAEQYLQLCSRRGKLFRQDRSTLRRLLAVLCEAGAIAPKPPEVSVLGPLEKLENDFERYLTQERGFATASDICHLPIFRQFLREHCTGGCGSLSNLTATAINKFVERHVNDHGPRSAQIMCSILRSFLRYLRYRGEISCDLASAVPTVRRWKLSSLPKYLDPRDIKRVLATCDRHTALGRRDYAILVVLARMGLRANEVRFLTLDDIDWESGQLTVRGKGRRDVVLPLPKEVGAAIADYLRHGRPRSDSRRLFLSYSAPHDGFSNSCTVTRVAAEALKRAGVDGVAHKGAHLFRHSLATQMLRAGASLTEIGQVLRHRNQDTTRIYAKVDLRSLRELALPWPGGVR